MALLDKFKRKKKEEEDFLKVGDDLDVDDGTGGYGPAGKEKQAPPSMELPMLPPPESLSKRDLDIINAKISTLATEIEALKHRVIAMENKLEPKESQPLQKLGPTDTEWHY